MISHRKQIIEQGAIPTEKIDDTLNITKVTPAGKAWRTFMDHLLLWIEGLGLAFSAMFFNAGGLHGPTFLIGESSLS